MTPTITVHNVHETRGDAHLHLYCGRNGHKYPHLINANLGNMHPVGYPCPECGEIHTRGHAVNAYDCTLENDPDHPHHRIIARIKQRFSEGKSIALYCHCSPQACHCDVIKRRALTP